MLALARREQIHLPPPGRERARVLSAHAKQNILGNVAEIEPNAAPVRSAVLANLVPNDIRFVSETPRLQHSDALGQQSVGAP